MRIARRRKRSRVSRALVLLGQIAQRHPQYAELRALAAGLAAVTGATLGYLSEGANAAGAALAGATPHRGPGGNSVARTGFDARAMLETARNAYILFGIEPTKDLAEGARSLAALRGAAVVAFTAFVSDELLDVADVLLPIGTFAETAGTFVNAEGRWQSFDAAADAVGEARPGWRVLRVLGNELELPNCEYRTPSDVAAELERELGAARAAPATRSTKARSRRTAAWRRRRPASCSTCRSTPSTRSCAAPSRCKRPCSAEQGAA